MVSQLMVKYLNRDPKLVHASNLILRHNLVVS
jgi:hypothetical protein